MAAEPEQPAVSVASRAEPTTRQRGARQLRIVQRNTYRFAPPDAAAPRSAEGAHAVTVQLRPRDRPHQHTTFFQLTSRPLALSHHARRDDDGNECVVLSFEPSPRLVITATSEVDLLPASAGGEHGRVALAASWEHARDQQPRYGVASPRVELAPLEPLRREAFVAGRSLGDALTTLFDALHRDIRYERCTTIYTTAKDVLDLGRGQCQDFAHLTIGALRAAGIGARYVGGYRLRRPGDRPPLELHAWVSVHTGAGWLDVDPTLRQLDASEHVTVAWGRDRADVSPIEGLDDGELELHLDDRGPSPG